MDLFFHAIGGGKDPDHVVFTGNTLAATDGGTKAIIWRADSGEILDDYLVQGNTFGQSVYIENATGSTVNAFRYCGNNGQIDLLNQTSGYSTGC